MRLEVQNSNQLHKTYSKSIVNDYYVIILTKYRVFTTVVIFAIVMYLCI